MNARVICCVWCAVFFAATGGWAVPALGQASGCRAVGPHDLSPGEQAYKDGFYAQAEQLYAQGLAERPNDALLGARLTETLLQEGKVGQAAERAATALAANPKAAATLTAMAEVEVREGQPWQAMKSLDGAEAADPCYARAHLVRSRIFHLDSMYASERAELQKAYAIDVTDPDILMAWSRLMPVAQQVEGTAEALGSMKDLDAEARGKAEENVRVLMPLLHENTQTCKVLPTAGSATMPLYPTREDGKHIDGFRVEVKFPAGPARLQLDTASSGLYISRALAEQNGFERALDAPVGTVQAPVVQIGPLEFRDCMVGVSELPFPGKADGFIGADMLASYLVTIDGREQKLKLDPLPPQPGGVLPGDRVRSGELAGFEPVYHRRQYLLVPVELNNKTRKLFALDTGMRMSAMDPGTAHLVSDMKVNFTNPLPVKSGQPVQVYRDHFDLAFAGLSMDRPTGSILAAEPTVIDHNTGLDVAGVLGFDVLGPLTVRLDYRDGLVKLERPEATEVAAKGKKPEAGQGAGSGAGPGGEEGPECPNFAAAEIPVRQTLELKMAGMLDSAHLKPGKEIYGQVVHGVEYPECTLETHAIVYGHVVAVSSSRNPDQSELALEFDHGDCTRHSKQPLALHLIALVAPPDKGPGSLHDALPAQVAGGGRQIDITAAQTIDIDEQLSEGGTPHMVHPGAVVGIPTMKLDPVGGPGCSARLTAAARSVQLSGAAELILSLSAPVQAVGGH